MFNYFVLLLVCELKTTRILLPAFVGILSNITIPPDHELYLLPDHSLHLLSNHALYLLPDINYKLLPDHELYLLPDHEMKVKD